MNVSDAPRELTIRQGEVGALLAAPPPPLHEAELTPKVGGSPTVSFQPESGSLLIRPRHSSGISEVTGTQTCVAPPDPSCQDSYFPLPGVLWVNLFEKLISPGAGCESEAPGLKSKCQPPEGSCSPRSGPQPS